MRYSYCTPRPHHCPDLTLLTDVSSAESVKEGLEASRARPIDVLLSDIGLPDGNGADRANSSRHFHLLTSLGAGWELMQQLRKERPMLCGIAISGYSTDDDLERSRSAGFIKHITVRASLPRPHLCFC